MRTLQAADLIQEYEAKIAALERMVGQAGAGDRAAKGGFEARTPAEKRDYLRGHRPGGISVSRGCELMGLPRSTFYDAPPAPRGRPRARRPGSARSATSSNVTVIGGLGRRCATRAWWSISKKLRRLMREHDLQPKRRRRYVATTDSDHAGPIFPDLAKDVVPDASQPAMGCGPDLCRHLERLRLSRRHSRRLVAQGRRLRDQPIHGRPHRRGCAESSDRATEAAAKGCIHHSDSQRITASFRAA